MCFWKIDRALGFSRRADFIGKGAASGVDQGARPIGGRGQGWAVPPGGEAGPWPLSVSSLVFVNLR
jgi:hypothetical protein